MRLPVHLHHQPGVFVLSAVYASVAGSLYAHYITVISPEIYSFLFSVVLVPMIANGGISLYWGAVVGAVLLVDIRSFAQDGSALLVRRGGPRRLSFGRGRRGSHDVVARRLTDGQQMTAGGGFADLSFGASPGVPVREKWI